MAIPIERVDTFIEALLETVCNECKALPRDLMKICWASMFILGGLALGNREGVGLLAVRIIPKSY